MPFRIIPRRDISFSEKVQKIFAEEAKKFAAGGISLGVIGLIPTAIISATGAIIGNIENIASAKQMVLYRAISGGLYGMSMSAAFCIWMYFRRIEEDSRNIATTAARGFVGFLSAHVVSKSLGFGFINACSFKVIGVAVGVLASRIDTANRTARSPFTRGRRRFSDLERNASALFERFDALLENAQNFFSFS